MSGHRISPPRIDGLASRAARPPAELPGSTNAWRQTGFLLGEDADLVVEGLNLEGEQASAAAGAKFRTRAVAAVYGPWSRGWLARLQALHALEWGDYSSAIVLARAAADFAAAAAALAESGLEEWSAWLDGGGIGDAHEQHAARFDLHPFRSAETLARLPELGAVYREASDLALPHFGATALVTASESSAERVLATFGDRDFHLGLAELVLGWLFRLGLIHWETVGTSAAMPPAPEGAAGWRARAERALGRRDRCRIERVEIDGIERPLIVNWRREPRAASRRVLL
ncbi:hypothetical protein [Tepidiforma sp.]|jgi:hypothetical protein|uniref:hypothetical protein n=1 Tax=Tepidiforma sp. TaxID=2682230 RepID=UPI00260D3501|nr:hypothetical protein [Tepidiforma sp.]MCX7616824.1 hypothetical protein [Tepidiforma sp.]